MKTLLVFWLVSNQPGMVTMPENRCVAAVQAIAEINQTIEDPAKRLNAACIRVFLPGGRDA